MAIQSFEVALDLLLPLLLRHQERNETIGKASNGIEWHRMASNVIEWNGIELNQIKSNQIKSNQIKSNQIKSNRIG